MLTACDCPCLSEEDKHHLRILRAGSKKKKVPLGAGGAMTDKDQEFVIREENFEINLKGQ